MAKYKTYDLIREIGKEQGKTISAIEKEAGLKPNSIKRWADSKPIANSLFAVARVLNVSAEQLVSDEEDGDAANDL